MDPTLRPIARELSVGPRWSIPRLGLDLALWLTLAGAAEAVAHPAATLVAAVAIGAGPLHDVLVHGHESTHGLAARSKALNGAVLWASHALLGLSGRAYRALHLDHHRTAHTHADTEVAFYAPRTHDPSGLDYLRIPVASHWVVNTWPWRGGRTRVTGAQVAADLLGALVLHAALVLLLGPWLWTAYVVAPVFTGLAAATVLRALTEHHGATVGDPWHATRATRAHPLLRWLWSNVDHHLEHHLCPGVPWHRLPEVRRRLQPHYAAHGVRFDDGLLRTAWRLLWQRTHFRHPAGAPHATR